MLYLRPRINIHFKFTDLNLPAKFLQSLEGLPGFDRQSFENIHDSSERITSIRLNTNKHTQNDLPYMMRPIPWTSAGYYLSERPFFTFDPFLHAGVYYVQEASSMFLEQAVKQTCAVDESIAVLDLCAAPGGKSTLLQSIISPESLLVSNELIRSRVTVLEENLAKWGALNVVVTNNDAKDFQRLEHFFDLVVVDAPCSGSGLFRKDPKAVVEWSIEAVRHCAQRQQRILTDVFAALKPGGVLIYSTCSYSLEEDEQIADWLTDSFQTESIKLQIDPAWKIVETQSPIHHCYGYRFYPDKVDGEGFYLACFRKSSKELLLAPAKFKRELTEPISKGERSLISSYIGDISLLFFWKLGERILAFPESLRAQLQLLIHSMYIRKAGVTIGKPGGKELVPDHELAMSPILSRDIIRFPLNKEDALQYLRKEEVTINDGAKGWAIVEYNGVALGWIKNLGNRVNNYYPKDWRILKSATN